MKHIYENLSLLNKYLIENNRVIELHVIGAFAFHLQNINIGRETEDFDNVTEISDQSILDKIHEIGESSGLPKWFDFSASSIILPGGYRDRLIQIQKYSHIRLKVLSIKDLIKLKVAAYYHRRDKGIVRDLEDLLSANPSRAEISEAIHFVIKEYGEELPSHFKKELVLNLKKIEEEIYELL